MSILILKNPSDNKVIPQHHLLVSELLIHESEQRRLKRARRTRRRAGAHGALCLRTSPQPSHASGQTFQQVLFGTFVNAVKGDLELLCYLRKPPLLHWAPGPSLGSSDSELFPDAKI